MPWDPEERNWLGWATPLAAYAWSVEPGACTSTGGSIRDQCDAVLGLECQDKAPHFGMELHRFGGGRRPEGLSFRRRLLAQRSDLVVELILPTAGRRPYRLEPPAYDPAEAYTSHPNSAINVQVD